MMAAWKSISRTLPETIDKITAADVVEMTNRWKRAVVDLDELFYADAKKEFAATAQIGFGVDGDERTKECDFAAVRGTLESDRFVAEIRKHIETKTELGNELLSRMEPLQAGT